MKIIPQTWSTILPASFLESISTNAFAVGADAVAGFAGTSVCSVAPIFVCNPYEESAGSMTDAQASAALNSAFDDPATLRRQLKLNRNGVGPGHFGWFNTADGCNDATCRGKNVAGASGACYSDAGVSLAIGNTNAVEPYLDTRFDIYNQDPPLASPSAAPPAVNVRKGYLPGHKANAVDWCSASPASGSALYYTYPSDRTVGVATQNSPTLTNVANPMGISDGEPVVDSSGVFASSADNPVAVSGVNGSTVTVGAPASETQASDGLTIEWTTSGLPEDVSFPDLGGAEGNGQWDCADYWAINHPHGPSAAAVGAALGGVCGAPAQTSVSRYQVYRYEISSGSRRVASTTGRVKMAGQATASPILRAPKFLRAISRQRAARHFAPTRAA